MTDLLRAELIRSGILPWLLIATMCLTVFIGFRLGISTRNKKSEKDAAADETMLGAIFGLMALIMAFTFSGASDRYDHRRELIAQEVNSIGTAYMSVDLLIEKDQESVRNAFKDLVNQRIALYDDVANKSAFEAKHQKLEETKNKLWAGAVSAVKKTPYPEKLVAAQILPAISSMNDAIDNQRLAIKMHPPRIILISLMLLVVIGSFVTGYNMGLRNKLDMLLIPLFVGLMTGAVYVTLNLEFPLIGLVGLEDFEIEMVNLRHSM